LNIDMTGDTEMHSSGWFIRDSVLDLGFEHGHKSKKNIGSGR